MTPRKIREKARPMDPEAERFMDLKYKADGCSWHTYTNYRGYLRRLDAFLKEHRGKTLLTAQQEDLQEFMGPFLFEQKLSGRSRRLVLSAVKGFYDYAKRSALRLDNPAEDLKYPRAGLRLPRFMQLQDAQKLIHQPDTSTFIGVRDLAMLLVMLGCGLRVGELVSLRDSNLLFGLDDKGNEMLFLRFIGKGNKERIVYAPDDTRLAIRAYLGHEKLREIDRGMKDGDRILFVSVGSRSVPVWDYVGEARRINPRSVWNLVMRYGRQAGLPRDVLHPHALRHTFATELVEEDTNILDVQAIMGHARSDTTAIYTHTATRKMVKAIRSAGPLAKIKTPFSELATALQRKG